MKKWPPNQKDNDTIEISIIAMHAASNNNVLKVRSLYCCELNLRYFHLCPVVNNADFGSAMAEQRKGRDMWIRVTLSVTILTEFQIPQFQ